MPEISTNFKGVIEKGDYDSGDYLWQVKEARADSGPNGVYIRLKLQFMDGKYAGLYTEEIISFSEKALWRAKTFLKCVGYDIPDGPFRFNTDDLLDLTFKGHGEKEIDPTGKYPPKLRITQFWNKDHNPTTLAPETATAQTTPPASGSAPATSPAAAPGNGEPAKEAAPTEPVARPKVKV
jgi:hypothetical protein